MAFIKHLKHIKFFANELFELQDYQRKDLATFMKKIQITGAGSYVGENVQKMTPASITLASVMHIPVAW